MRKLLLTNAGWIATPERPGENHAIYRIHRRPADTIYIEGENIAWIGRYRDFAGGRNIEKYDLDGMGVTPGLIDFHAHPVFAATRETEYEMRTSGASYQEIAKSGGGILNSVKKVRKASQGDLIDHTTPFLDSMLAHGTTTLEAKSGYGLTPDSEYKMLRTIIKLNETHVLDLIPTFLGAHEYPAEFKENHEGYLKLLIEEMLPTVARENLAVTCDIFCETGVYSVEEAERVLYAALQHGLSVKVHADQLTNVGATKMAARMGALSADHIEFIDDEAVNQLALSGTVAGLLPVAAHFLRMKEDPPVRQMIERGITCALATDFNPGSAMCENMQMAMHLASIRFRVSAEEALWMATAGSATALALKDRGWLGPGALADLVVWDIADIQMLTYHFGVNHASKVFKRGNLVAENGRAIV
ncbi:imidazolonepropionase [bacterium]|nr:imidazolonepropionase [bacterium]